MTAPVLAFVDASPYAASVCDHAAWAATRTGAPVTVMHVLGRREAADRHDLSGAMGLGARSALLAELAEIDARRARLLAQRGRAILDDAQAILTRHGVAEVTTRLRHGDLVETVTELDATAGLLVIGKRGEAADFARGHLGSNLERLVRATTRPVLVASRAFRPVARVLLAHDGGPSAQKAVAHVAHDPLFADLRIDLVTVAADTPDIRARLAEARAPLAAAGRAGDTRIVPGHPDSALGALVDSDGYDLVVMGSFGHARLRRMIIGSTTAEMIRACKVPLFLVR